MLSFHDKLFVFPGDFCLDNCSLRSRRYLFLSVTTLDLFLFPSCSLIMRPLLSCFCVCDLLLFCVDLRTTHSIHTYIRSCFSCDQWNSHRKTVSFCCHFLWQYNLNSSRKREHVYVPRLLWDWQYHLLLSLNLVFFLRLPFQTLQFQFIIPFDERKSKREPCYREAWRYYLRVEKGLVAQSLSLWSRVSHDCIDSETTNVGWYFR